jgi:DNA-directed RNA polymerase specialized sigma subunit
MPAKPKKAKDENSYYINNTEFQNLIIKYKLTRDPELLEILVTDFFYVLVYNIIKTFNFKIDSDDALQEGVMMCLKKLDHFDPARGKGFNFFTTIVLNGFRGVYKSKKNYEELKLRFLTQQVTMLNATFPGGRKIIHYIESNGEDRED